MRMRRLRAPIAESPCTQPLNKEELTVPKKSQSESLFGLPLPVTPPAQLIEAKQREDVTAARTVEVEIPMRDGVVLAADVHLPAAHQLPAPAIILGTPYDKSNSTQDTAAFREYGYIGVTFDVRGRGKSEGIWHPWERDGEDGYDVVEWIAAQEWCTGKVGAIGLSYPGWVVVATVAQQPPHLGAAISSAAPGRWFDELPYANGCFYLWHAYWFSLCRRRITNTHCDTSTLQAMLPVEAIGTKLEAAGPGWAELMQHDTLDSAWSARRWDGEYDFDVPMLHVTGWHDDTVRGAIHHYEQMDATSPARDSQYLLVGPWLHGGCRWPSAEYDGVPFPAAAIDMDGIYARFFDHFLKGEANGVEDEPRVRLYDQGTDAWRMPTRWNAGTKWRRVFLAADKALSSRDPGEIGFESYRYDPMQPNGWALGGDNGSDPPFELTGLEAQSGVLSWTSDSLTEDLTVHGWSEVDLYAETDRDDTEWHVKLADVDELGCSRWYGWGCLRASYAENPRQPAGVTPGELRRYRIALTPLYHTFKEGHKLRLVVASSEFPLFARNLNRFEPIPRQSEPLVATNKIHYGRDHPSCLRLNVDLSGGGSSAGRT
jgi:putative CocE/NonD family hydrolase